MGPARGCELTAVTSRRHSSRSPVCRTSCHTQARPGTDTSARSRAWALSSETTYVLPTTMTTKARGARRLDRDLHAVDADCKDGRAEDELADPHDNAGDCFSTSPHQAGGRHGRPGAVTSHRRAQREARLERRQRLGAPLLKKG